MCHDGVRVRCPTYFLYDDPVAFEGGVGLMGWYPEGVGGLGPFEGVPHREFLIISESDLVGPRQFSEA